MANISFDGREPVQLTWGVDGKLVVAHALDSNERRTFGGGNPSSSAANDSTQRAYPSFQFLAAREKKGPARNGFLLSSRTDSTEPFICLNVRIHGEQDRMNPNSIRSGTIDCRLGFLARSMMAKQPIHILIEQTAHRNWASALFLRVRWEADQIGAGAAGGVLSSADGFAPVCACSLDESEKIRLAMLLHADFWERISASRDVKQRDLLDLGLNVGTASAVGKIFERMELEIDRM